MSSGGLDYITKPVGYGHLAARKGMTFYRIYETESRKLIEIQKAFIG